MSTMPPPKRLSVDDLHARLILASSVLQQISGDNRIVSDNPLKLEKDKLDTLKSLSDVQKTVNDLKTLTDMSDLENETTLTAAFLAECNPFLKHIHHMVEVVANVALTGEYKWVHTLKAFSSRMRNLKFRLGPDEQVEMRTAMIAALIVTKGDYSFAFALKLSNGVVDLISTLLNGAGKLNLQRQRMVNRKMELERAVRPPASAAQSTLYVSTNAARTKVVTDAVAEANAAAVAAATAEAAARAAADKARTAQAAADAALAAARAADARELAPAVAPAVAPPPPPLVPTLPSVLSQESHMPYERKSVKPPDPSLHTNFKVLISTRKTCDNELPVRKSGAPNPSQSQQKVSPPTSSFATNLEIMIRNNESIFKLCDDAVREVNIFLNDKREVDELKNVRHKLTQELITKMESALKASEEIEYCEQILIALQASAKTMVTCLTSFPSLKQANALASVHAKVAAPSASATPRPSYETAVPTSQQPRRLLAADG